MSTRRRADDGAVAIMVALMALVLLGVAALTVDLGQAFVKQRDVQKQTDFAALAGAAGDDLPMTAAGTECSITTPDHYGGVAPQAVDDAIIDAAAYLSDQPHTGEVTPDQLVDCWLGNGEAAYGMFRRDSAGVHLDANPNQLSVISPPKQVDFGFGTILGFDNVDVAGQATVEIKTPLINTLPLYAFSGCDFGSQTIAQPTNGHSSDGVNLKFQDNSNTNDYVTFSKIELNPVSTTTPPSVLLNSTATSMTITGENLDMVSKVGFFRSTATNPPDPVEVLKTDPSFSLNGTTTIVINPLPYSVTSVQDTWFVRLYGIDKANKTTQSWTGVTINGNADKNNNLAALPFTVGNATLNCQQGSSDGNFGTLLLENTSSGAPNGQSDNIAYNIADGLQHTLAPFPVAYRTPPGFTCVTGQPGAVLWPEDGTNCVDTKTGLDSAAAEAGFITGVAGKPGLLTDVSSNAKCPFNRPTGTTHQTTAPTGQTVNNDVLTCYFTNDTVTVGDVSAQGYAGDVVIDQSIYRSPRFVQVPVLGRMPTSGGSDKYEIVDFRPGFITDQPSDATRLTGVPTAGNGITWTSNNKLQAVTVIFLSLKALPNPPVDENGEYIPYAGSGKKIPLLVN